MVSKYLGTWKQGGFAKVGFQVKNLVAPDFDTSILNKFILNFFRGTPRPIIDNLILSHAFHPFLINFPPYSAVAQSSKVEKKLEQLPEGLVISAKKSCELGLIYNS